jgi:hypothetical protein
MDYPRLVRCAVASLVAAGALAALGGCTARTNVGLTGTAPPDIAHLWITVEEVSFASAADTPPESATGWTRESLSKPVVIDLANVDPGTLVSLVSNLSVPAGRYRQLHLGLADASERLLAEARAVGLEYNAQVDTVDGDGRVARTPLELPVPGAGITIPVDLTFEDDSRLSGTGSRSGDVTNLAVALDAARDVVTYEYGANTGYILSPATSVDDAAAAGAVSGRVDASGLPDDHPPIFVSAQVEDDSGARRVVARRGVAGDGSFSLYPLPAAAKGGTTYDVVIACAGADTVVIRDVLVSDGAATQLQATPIAMTPAGTVYADVAAGSDALPAGTRVEFYQTNPGDEVPYVIDGQAIDPLSRALPGNAFALSSGVLFVGGYANGEAIAFAATTAAEGTGGYRIGSAARYRVRTVGRDAFDVRGSRRSPTVVTAPYPPIAEGGLAGSLTVSISAPAGRYNRGFVTVSAGHGVVETARVDELLALGGGSVALADLPAGSALVPAAGVPYQVSVRAWDARNPGGTITRVSAGASVALGDAALGNVALQFR